MLTIREKSLCAFGCLTILCCAILLTAAPGVLPAAEPSAKAQASAADLVRQLGGDSFKDRESAQKALIAMGAAAADAVAAGMKSTDEETRSRCEIIMVQIQKDVLAAKTAAIAKSVLWKLPMDAAPAGPVAVVKGLGLVVDTKGKLHAIDLANGKEKWKANEKIGAMDPVAPVVADGVAYVACINPDAKDGKMFYTAAIDAASGKQLWQSAPQKECSPPTVADGVVYVSNGEPKPVAFVPGMGMGMGGGMGGGMGPAVQPKPATPADQPKAESKMDFEALDAKTGKSLWKLRLGVLASRPVIGKGLAFLIGDDQKVHAIDLKTKKESWASEPLKAQVQAIRADAAKVLVHTQSAMISLDAATGKQAWSLDLPDPFTQVINGMNIRIAIGINGNLGPANRSSAISQDDCAFWLEQGTAYVCAGQKIIAVEAKGGKKLWEIDMQGDAQKNAAGGGGVGGGGGVAGGGFMIVGGGQVIINGGGRMIVNGRPVGGPGYAGAPVVYGGVVYYGASDGLHAADLRTGQETWVLHTPGPVCSRPVVADGVMYFGVAENAPAMPLMPLMPPGAKQGGGIMPIGPAANPPPANPVAAADKLPAFYAVRLPK